MSLTRVASNVKSHFNTVSNSSKSTFSSFPSFKRSALRFISSFSSTSKSKAKTKTKSKTAKGNKTVISSQKDLKPVHKNSIHVTDEFLPKFIVKLPVDPESGDKALGYFDFRDQSVFFEVKTKYDSYEPILSQVEHKDELTSLLVNELPKKCSVKNWRLTFSTALHGYNLDTLFRLASTFTGPSVLIVKDEENNIFGSFISTSLKKLGHKYFGTGETFLFKLFPVFKVFKPRFNKDNSNNSNNNCNNFVVANTEYLAFGSDNFGLFFDQNFDNCVSHFSKTFENEVLSSKGNFKAVCVEVWSFESPFRHR